MSSSSDPQLSALLKKPHSQPQNFQFNSNAPSFVPGVPYLIQSDDVSTVPDASSTKATFPQQGSIELTKLPVEILSRYIFPHLSQPRDVDTLRLLNREHHRLVEKHRGGLWPSYTISCVMGCGFPKKEDAIACYRRVHEEHTSQSSDWVELTEAELSSLLCSYRVDRISTLITDKDSPQYLRALGEVGAARQRGCRVPPIFMVFLRCPNYSYHHPHCISDHHRRLITLAAQTLRPSSLVFGFTYFLDSHSFGGHDQREAIDFLFEGGGGYEGNVLFTMSHINFTTFARPSDGTHGVRLFVRGVVESFRHHIHRRHLQKSAASILSRQPPPVGFFLKFYKFYEHLDFRGLESVLEEVLGGRPTSRHHFIEKWPTIAYDDEEDDDRINNKHYFRRVHGRHWKVWWVGGTSASSSSDAEVNSTGARHHRSTTTSTAVLTSAMSNRTYASVVGRRWSPEDPKTTRKPGENKKNGEAGNFNNNNNYYYYLLRVMLAEDLVEANEEYLMHFQVFSNKNE